LNNWQLRCRLFEKVSRGSREKFATRARCGPGRICCCVYSSLALWSPARRPPKKSLGRAGAERPGGGQDRVMEGRGGARLRSSRAFSTRCTVAWYASLLVPRDRITRIPRYYSSRDFFVIREVIGRKRVGTSRSSEVYLARNEGTPSHLVRRLGTVPEHRPCGTSLGILERSTSPGRPSVKTLSRSLAESGSNKWSSRGEIARLFIVDLGPPFLTRDILGGRRRRSRRGEGGRSED